MNRRRRVLSPAPRTRAGRAVAAHVPGYRGDSGLRALGGGLDHAAFVVGDLVVRVSPSDRPEEAAREAGLLRVVAASVSLPVPVPAFADPVLGVLGYRRLPGQPLLGRTPPAGAAAHLGRFLRDLHRVDPATVGELAPVDPADPDEWLGELTGPEALTRIIRTRVPRAARSLVMAHADLGAEHILELEGRLTGVIDWTDAAVTDPALDLARLYRDFGPAFLGDVLAAYGEDSPELRARVLFFARCAALEDLVFGQESGREDYYRAAERSLSWLFPGAGGPAA